MASSDNYEDDFDTDTTDNEADNKHKPGRQQALKEIVNDLGSTESLLNVHKPSTRMNSKNKGQRGVANRRTSLPKVNEGSSSKGDANKKIDAYKRANERLRGELDKCIDSQYRVRELEDQLKNKRDEMKKLTTENGRLEKMLEKPVRDVVEVDNGHMDKIRVLTNDLRLLQDKTRKYKSRALEAERSVQRLTVQLGELQSKNDKLLVLLKEVKKDGMDSKERTDMESAVARNEQKAQALSRELQLCKKKHASDLKKFRLESHAANMEVERLREKAERSEGVLKEVQMEARILSLKLRNEHRGKPKQKIKLGLVEHILEAKSEPSRSATHRSEATSSKDNEHYAGLSLLEKSILSDLPPARRKELVLKLSPRGDLVPARDERAELQDKMDALRLRQAKVAQQDAAEDALRESEARQQEQEEDSTAGEHLEEYCGLSFLEKSILPANSTADTPSARSELGDHLSERGSAGVAASQGEPTPGRSIAVSQGEPTPGRSIAASQGEQSPESSIAASQGEQSPGRSVAASQGEPTPGRSVAASQGEQSPGSSVAASQGEQSPDSSIAASQGEQSPGSSVAASQGEQSPGSSVSIAASQGEQSPGSSVGIAASDSGNILEQPSEQHSGEHTARSAVAAEMALPEQDACALDDEVRLEDDLQDAGYTDDEFDVETPQRSVAPTPVPPECDPSEAAVDMPVETESCALVPPPAEAAPVARKVSSMPSKPNFGGAKKKKW